MSLRPTKKMLLDLVESLQQPVTTQTLGRRV